MSFIPSTRRAALIPGVMIVLPQDGVLEGPVHYDSRDPSTQFTLDSRNGNGGTANPKRPKNLEVSSTNGYATKSIVADTDDIEDGSLPCTPELQSDSEAPSCPAGDEVLENDTRQLICQYLKDVSGLSKPRWHDSKALSTMKRVVEDLLEKYRYTYNGMINKLSLDDRGDDVRFVSTVAKSLFADGTTNWGRIASLVAFGAVVCQYLKEKGRGDCVELVGQEISTYLLSDQRDWLVKNNSWDGFVEFFRVADPESTVRHTLMAVAGVAGLGATLALLISRNNKMLTSQSAISAPVSA
ncbi:induced myeloid leukemia cell differentiation protein Mcl-1b isoform X2 [Mastacembelus armatus]|uniref:MCL1 apoptosis regulator, BCL2 family member b n=1 Tax=Mastacembelus armatus TaxID=205130 RepID=A0A3Q3S6A5_9TELE|nr:induced myeloid leukemia cell differentiation protein Mcl-1 homolog isoform X2 [Mastacembelus armatus]